jgi:DNA-binding transcriptional LysR family regulator
MIDAGKLTRDQNAPAAGSISPWVVSAETQPVPGRLPAQISGIEKSSSRDLPPLAGDTVRAATSDEVKDSEAVSPASRVGDRPDGRGRSCLDFYDAANARPFDWELRQARKILPVKPSDRLMVSDVGAMLSACEAGVGIAQIMALGSSHLLAEGQLIELFPAGEVSTLTLRGSL